MGINGLDIKEERLDDVSVLTLTGRLDAGSAERLLKHIKALLKDHQNRIILDLKSLEFIDSSGVGMLLSAYRLLEGHGGTLKICSINQQVKSLFGLTRLGEFFEFFGDRESAIEAEHLKSGR